MSSDACPMYVTLRVENHEVVKHVVGLLSKTEGDAETVAIVDPCNDESQACVFDFADVTKKQWEALETAQQLGHYNGKRGGNLTKIADELDISESAASQHLRAAESKIVSSVLGRQQIHCELV